MFLALCERDVVGIAHFKCLPLGGHVLMKLITITQYAGHGLMVRVTDNIGSLDKKR